jgi:hypothetical protein
VLKGNVVVRAAGRRQNVTAEHALGIHGNGGRVTFESARPPNFALLSGAEIREPVVAHDRSVSTNARRSTLHSLPANLEKWAIWHSSRHSTGPLQTSWLAAPRC